jgi:adenylate kinase
LLVIDIVVPEVELVRRLASRMICGNCGANAGEAAGNGLKATASSDACHRCGGPLVQRADDSDGVVRERLKVYHCQTEPLVEYYRPRSTFRSVNGAQAPDEVAADLAAAVDAVHGVLRRAEGGASR